MVTGQGCKKQSERGITILEALVSTAIIAIGFIAYVVLKYSSGKKSDISLGAWFLFVIFLMKFIILD